jgi:hypothetical protein
MILVTIGILTFFQVLVYVILDENRVLFPKLPILLLLLILEFFILPPYFYPEKPPGEPGCGLPLLGIMLAFWIIGGGVAVVTHILYGLWAAYRYKK